MLKQVGLFQTPDAPSQLSFSDALPTRKRVITTTNSRMGAERSEDRSYLPPCCSVRLGELHRRGCLAGNPGPGPSGRYLLVQLHSHPWRGQWAVCLGRTRGVQGRHALPSQRSGEEGPLTCSQKKQIHEPNGTESPRGHPAKDRHPGRHHP